MSALAALALSCVFGLSSAQKAGAQTPYLQFTTAGNISGDLTYLKKDTKPGSLYFITSNWNPPGKPSTFNNHPTGVFYSGPQKGWAIFNQDAAAMPAGASFNVIGLQARDNIYAHTANVNNTIGNATVLDNPYTNNNPNALVWATPNWNNFITLNHNISVAYTGGHWTIFNEDGAPIPAGASFNVMIADGPFYPAVYVQTATVGNISGGTTYLDNPLINGGTNHQLMVTPNWNPGGVGGVLDNHVIGVWYDTVKKRYGIFNQDGSPMPIGASFNVWIMK